MAIKIGTIDVTGVAVGETSIGSVAVGSDFVLWEVIPDPLCFTGTATDSVRMTKVGNPDSANIEYSKDGSTWTTYTFGNWIDFDGTGNKVYFRAASDNNTSFYTNDNNRYKFELDENSPTTVSGNIDTLLHKNGVRHVRKQGTFRDFFGGLNIVDASQLELPSMTLPSLCYYGMFQNCTSLSAAPELPATTLGASCYRSMFEGCSSLVSAPSVLPATTTQQYCYSRMFYGCTALKDAPEICATTLTTNCFQAMFSTDSSLSSVSVAFTDWQDDVTPTSYWLYQVAASGTFLCPEELSVIRGTSNIPTNWEVKNTKALCFTAEEANSTVAMEAQGSAPTVSLEYSTDGRTWSPFVVGTTTVTLANIGDKVYVRATSEGNTGIGSSPTDYNKFVMTGKIAASGNVDTLLDKNGNATLTSYCYSNMFNGCASLTTAPTLPATTLANNCYASMFQGCTSLVTAPVLPATVLADGCYWYMFKNCTSLTTAPALPATTLSIGCYRTMFQGCSNLNNITLGYTGNFADAPTNAFDNWVDGVASTGTFYYNGSDTTTGASAIPTGWTVTPLTP